ncbi:hypothetical protein CEP52_008207 [Fusarium oligoseptatum]|uniref:SET domain-containing protein n=1 Tax=Fusarium oligoseptatum TaxID=2604345 RepID=A0A428TJ83_9HYPO|nr:hypothetical protein CEP52_008207 [Fusarium oligoseptatum]
MTTPLWFEEQELAYLKGTNLFSNDTPSEQTSIGLQRGLYREQWELGIMELKNAGELVADFTWELFLWAQTIFSSRSFTSDLFTSKVGTSSFPVLYPMLDIFNHNLGTKVSWKFHSGDFSLCLEEKVEQGEQIFNNYSPKGNEDLLMGFGFCIPDNPYDQVAVRLGQISPDVHRQLHQSIPTHWQSETWEPKESVFHLRATSQSTPDNSNTYRVPNLTCLRGIPPELAKSVYIIMLEHSKTAVSSNEVPDEKEIWAGTIDVLLHQMEATLMGITRWNGELPDLPSTARGRAALLYRTGQVKILEGIISELKAFMDPLRAGEISIQDLFK